MSQRKNSVLLVALVAVSACFGIPARPNLHSVRQPDGTIIRLRVRGDETGHWHEDADGFVIVRDHRTRDWRYARRDAAGTLTQTVHRVGRVRPESLGLVRGERPKGHPRHLRANGRALAEAAGISLPLVTNERRPLPAVLTNLVVLMEFPDLKFRYSVDDFDALYNQVGYAGGGQHGSVKDYFRETSYGKLTIESIVIGPFTASHGFAYYGESSGRPLRVCDLAAEALAAAKAAGFDFSQCDANGDEEIDGFDMIHAGWGAEAQADASYSDYIWAQSWDLRTPVIYDGVRIETYHTEGELRGEESAIPAGITAVGSICHETGHALGLPDLYDTDGSNSGAGHFCLMASGSWCGPDDDGTVPCHPSVWCKAFLGWLEPSEITESDSYGLPRIEDHPVAAKLHGKFTSPGEYFLLENRQGVGFDSCLPGAKRGLLIWHVDEAQSGNDNERHYQVDLEEASGTQHLEWGLNNGDDGDYFRADTQTSFTSSTMPNNLGCRSERLGLSVLDIGPSQAEMSFRVEAVVERAGFTVEDGVLLSWDGLGPTDLTVPADLGVRAVAAKAFYGNAKVTSVTLPATVTDIGSEAFLGCGRLTNVVFGLKLMTIGKGAFYMCPKLAGRLYLPASVRTVGTEAFALTGFDSVVFMGTPQTLGGAVFQGCRSLANVFFKGNAPLKTGDADRFGRVGLYEGAPSDLVTFASTGSSGWGVASFPAAWPVGDGAQARTIKSYSPFFTVCQAKNDGTGETRSQTYELGVAKCLLWKDSQLGWSRSGYSFVGWRTASGPGLIQYVNGESVTDLATAGRTVNLYAAWLGTGSYRVTYHRNFDSADTTIRDDLFVTGAERRLSWKDAQLGWTPNGFAFLGWALQPNPALVSFENGAGVRDLAADGKTVHLYAVWLCADSYKVVFHRNQPDFDEAEHVQGIRRDQPTTLAWFNSQHGWAAPRGKAFLGWSKSASATQADFANGEKVTNLTAGGKTIHLYAVYAQNK